MLALIPPDGIVHRELLPVHRPIGRCHADRVIVRPIAADFADLDDPNDLSDRNWVWCHVFPPPFTRCAAAHRELIVVCKFAIVNIVIAKIINFVHFRKITIGDDAFGHGTLCAKRRILV